MTANGPVTDRTAGPRVRFNHHLISIDNHRQVGVSVAGHGVPLIFFHGIGMNRLAYLNLLSRLPALGFLVVAVDAPGHGQSFAPLRGQRNFTRRMEVTDAVLDELGIERAVLVGHSMGGRTVAELAARRRERALAAVLINAAVGSEFDASRARIHSPWRTASALAAAIGDTVIDRVGLSPAEHVRHLRRLAQVAARTATHPTLFASAAAAIARADDSLIALQSLRHNRIPSAVIHGERDKIAPVNGAVEAARAAGATLVTLPAAYHSWVLTTPSTFVTILTQLIDRGLLGPELRGALAAGAPTTRFYGANALVHTLTEPTEPLRTSRAQRREVNHTYRFWTTQQLEDSGA